MFPGSEQLLSGYIFPGGLSGGGGGGPFKRGVCEAVGIVVEHVVDVVVVVDVAGEAKKKKTRMLTEELVCPENLKVRPKPRKSKCRNTNNHWNRGRVK